MSETYELTRRIIRRGTFRTMTTERFRKAGGVPLYSGEVRMGYLDTDAPFVDADNRPAVTVGPNRTLAPSAHRLRRGDGALIAEIRHGLVQSAWGGKGFAVKDASGAPLFDLVPGETLKLESGQPIGDPFSDALYAVRGKDILGHTGSETEAARSGDGGARTTKRGRRLAMEIPGLLANIFKEEILGRPVEREEAVAARFTLLADGTLEPRIIFAILMFKLHYHDMRGPDG